jgi:hypothetical protein
LLYTARRKGKPGPKGPSQELIDAIAEMKRRNSRFGCPRIAQEINKAFGLNIDKDIVTRVLAKHYRPGPDSGHGPSWLTFIGHLKDSLWSADLFIERLIGTIRREFLDHTLFWNTIDLERKLDLFKDYYNHSRTHSSLDGNTPAEISGDSVAQPAPLNSYTWEKHCGGLFQLPVAA